MTNRTVTLPTLDHDNVTLTCPAWCAGHEAEPQYRSDLFHEGVEQQLTLPVRGGTAELLLVAFESRPFTEGWTGTLPFVSVGFGGDHYPIRVDGLEAMADALEEHAATLREYAHQLATLLAEAPQAAEQAARASVDRAFPTVARFLADEHAERGEQR